MEASEIEQHIRHIYTYLVDEIKDTETSLSVLQSVSAIALVCSTRDKKDALSSASLFARNIQAGIKKIYKHKPKEEFLRLVK